VELQAVTDAHLFSDRASRFQAAAKARAQLPAGSVGDLLCDGLQNLPKLDTPERTAWKTWPGVRLSPKQILGEGLMAAAAWQCVGAVETLRRGRCQSANVSVVGCNQQAIGASFRI
jgi:hypothetical protein